jgi:tetratricopeptide (TPR) repeat protein
MACVLGAIMAGLWAPAAWGQLTSVKGYVHDSQGNPLSGATLQFSNRANGRKYELKTNTKGEYYSLGIVAGRYDMVVLKDGKQIWTETNLPVELGEKDNVFNVDLKKEQAAQEAALPAEVKKQQEEQQKEVTKIKSLNEKLAQAKAAQDAGNPQQAAAILTEATQMDPSQPVIWAALAEAERGMAAKQTDPAEKRAAYIKAVEDYKKAIALKPSGSYYNNMGDAAARSGDSQTAVQAYLAAASADPTNAAQYYYNEGAVLTNTGKVDESRRSTRRSRPIPPRPTPTIGRA